MKIAYKKARKFISKVAGERYLLDISFIKQMTLGQRTFGFSLRINVPR